MATFLATGEGLTSPDSKPVFQGKLHVYVSLNRENDSLCVLLCYIYYGMAVDKIAKV